MSNAITRYRGDTVADEFVITDDTGAVIDITGFTFLMTISTIKAPPDDTTEVYQLTGTIEDAPNGLVSFAPNATQANQPPAKYFYDVQMIDGGGKIRTLVLDSYTYRQDITK